MKELSEFCKELKKDFTPRIKDTKKPVSFWSEKDILNKKIVDAFVIILRTRGCSWALKSGCSMCGYFNDSIFIDVSDNDLITQFEKAMDKYNNQRFVKIFTSGSFLDDKEITPNVRKKILTKLFETAEKVSIESRPEYITDNKIKELKKIIGTKTFEIGIGLETADDNIRQNFLNKGFKFNDYKKAASILKKHKISLKTYVLIKPPFLTEKESIDDAIKTVKKIKNITNVISFNPVNIQKNTVVSYLWNHKKYRPAWLFSVVEILKESKKIAGNIHIKCDISGGGNIRGAHNCKTCDKEYLKTIADFSLNQDINVFKKLKCNCKEMWLDQLDLEDTGFGSLINMYG
ncbi:MAG: TIGR01210 family radical SAM protein [Thermoplasmata archaeon M9B1D]|nr:MAG: TIGR01210 family radical SAM protein [Thermoplasmata archaeon M9B1D]PNX47970.1 MAG: TIGR01210 family radical SAM protein [Thermoplasmata archaeon M8B2D]